MTDIFRTVLNMSITGAYIAAAIIILRFFMKKLPKKYSYALWSIPGIRLLCPFSFSSAVSLFNLIRPETSENRMTYIPDNIEYSPAPKVTVTVPAADNTINNTLPAAAPHNSVNIMETVLTVCAWVWLIGVIAMLIYTVFSYLKVRKIVADSRCIGDNIYVCGNILSPFVYGIIRPRIYVPEGVSENDMRYIIAHEKTHIKRGDHIIKLIAMAALSLHWFDPLVWVSYRLMVKDMELSCDEKAVQSFDSDVRKDYANALLNMSVKQNGLYGMLAFGESNIKARIKGVLSLKKPKVIAAVTAVVLLIVAAVCLLTNAESPAEIEDGRYISGRNIAIAAYSSTFGDDSGYFYDFEGDTLTITPRENDMSRAYELSKWTALPYSAEEWGNMTEMLPGFDMSGYKSVRYMKLDSSYLLMKADGELWIAEIHGAADTANIWSIYSLVPYDQYVNDNYNMALNSFEITRTEDGYEVRSPLTDIYFFFTEDEHENLHVRRNSGETTEETVIPYLGGFDPYKTGLYLSDITGDGTDDIFVNTYFTGTGVVDDATAVIDGSTMEEIPINRLEAERLISEASAELLKNEDFTAFDLYISANMPEMNESYIYPDYPDKSVRRYGGMMYELADGQVVGSSVFGFVRNESEYSELYRAGIVFEYRDGELTPVSISVRKNISEYQIPVHNSYAAVNKDGYVYNIPIEEGYQFISPYIWGDTAQAPVSAEYSDNSLRLYPTENADGQYSLLRLLHDGENYYYEISDTNFQNWFTVDKETWQTLEMNIDMYSLRKKHAVIKEKLSDGKYIVSSELNDYTIYSDRGFDVGDKVTILYLGNVLAVDNALLDAVEVIPDSEMPLTPEYDTEGTDGTFSKEFSLCASYLTEYINASFGRGDFNAEKYSDNKSFTEYSALKYTFERAVRADSTLTGLIIHSYELGSGFKNDGTKWLAFSYETSFRYPMSAEDSGYGRMAYFEYSEDVRGNIRIISAADFGICDGSYFSIQETAGEPPYDFDFDAAAAALRSDLGLSEQDDPSSLPALTVCKSYLTDYWNDLFKTGEFLPESYISDPDMLNLANARKLYNADTEGNGVKYARAVIDERTVHYGRTSEGRLWICFMYDVMLSLDDGTESSEHYKDYTAYFELTEMGAEYEIYREYQLWGAELTAPGLGDDLTFPIENVDINEVIRAIYEPKAAVAGELPPYVRAEGRLCRFSDTRAEAADIEKYAVSENYLGRITKIVDISPSAELTANFPLAENAEVYHTDKPAVLVCIPHENTVNNTSTYSEKDEYYLYYADVEYTGDGIGGRDFEVTETYFVKLSVNELSPENGCIEINIANNSSTKALYFGPWWTLQRKTDSGWQDVVPVSEGDKNTVWTAPLNILGSRTNRVMWIYWKFNYGELPEGEYRIVMEFSYGELESEDSIYAACEFEITE